MTRYAEASDFSGAHPCIGMPIARAVIKGIVSMFLLSFDYRVVDEKGSIMVDLPLINRNDLHKARPARPVRE